MNNPPELEYRQHCMCRTFLGHNNWLPLGYDENDSYGDIYDNMWHICNNCTMHGVECPPFSTHVFDVRTKGPYRFEHGEGSAVDMVCKEIVEYCVDEDTFHGLVAKLLRPENLAVPARVLIVGECANTHQAARNSIQSIVAELVRPGPINTTLTASDFPEFRDRCSGCNLFTIPEGLGQNGWSFHRGTYRGISQDGWFGAYNCKFCPSRFSTKRHWREHQTEKHNEAVQDLNIGNVFRCSNCHKIYTIPYHLELHWRKEHEELLIQEENVSFCFLCGTEHHDVHGLATHRSGPDHKKALAARPQEDV